MTTDQPIICGDCNKEAEECKCPFGALLDDDHPLVQGTLPTPEQELTMQALTKIGCLKADLITRDKRIEELEQYVINLEVGLCVRSPDDTSTPLQDPEETND